MRRAIIQAGLFGGALAAFLGVLTLLPYVGLCLALPLYPVVFLLVGFVFVRIVDGALGRRTGRGRRRCGRADRQPDRRVGCDVFGPHPAQRRRRSGGTGEYAVAGDGAVACGPRVEPGGGDGFCRRHWGGDGVLRHADFYRCDAGGGGRGALCCISTDVTAGAIANAPDGCPRSRA